MAFLWYKIVFDLYKSLEITLNLLNSNNFWNPTTKFGRLLSSILLNIKNSQEHLRLNHKLHQIRSKASPPTSFNLIKNAKIIVAHSTASPIKL